MTENLYQTNIRENFLMTEELKNTLYSVSKWAKLLSIIAFIILGLSVLVLLITGLLVTGTNRYMEATDVSYYSPGIFQWSYAIFYLIIMAMLFIPVYFLYKFSVNLKKSLETGDSGIFINAFNFLKKHYLFIGIYSIVSITAYIITSILIISSMMF